MNIKEIIRTSGDVRRQLAQTMSDIRSGEVSVAQGMCLAALAKEISASLQVEVNIAKVKTVMLREGSNIGRLTEIGAMVIEDAGSVPTLDGR